MRHLVVGTAGHIDHGKSALVEALTGVHPDRLEEERRRGITIELGFADLDLAPDGVVSLVDVPGHERFVRHMVAGASGMDAVLLVVAADEGVKPQTREHLVIAKLLDVKSGIVVLSKADLGSDELREVVALEVEDLVRGSFLEGAPVLPVSAKTGAGLDALRNELRSLVRNLPARTAEGVVRLPIDRSFVLKGFGTVVTGTLASGTLREGDDVEVLPGGRRARVRGLQVHNRTTGAVSAGSRVAVNLQGIDCAGVPRGTTLTSPGGLRPTRRARVRVELLPSSPPRLRRGGAVRFHQGTCERAARLRADDASGSGSFEADLRLDEDTVLLPGDRFILRRPAPVDTVGGGVVIDAHPPLRRTRRGEPVLAASSDDAVVVRIARGGIEGRTSQDLAVELGLSPTELIATLTALVESGRIVRSGAWLFDAGMWTRAREALVAVLEQFHREEPLASGMEREALRKRAAAGMPLEAFRELLRSAVDAGIVSTSGDRVAAAGFRVVLSPADEAAAGRIEAAFLAADLDPPDAEAVLRASGGAAGPKLVKMLVERGRLVKIADGRLFHAEALQRLRLKLRAYAGTSSTIDVGSFKDLAGVTRKNAIPLLEQFDQERLTRREGNVRRILTGEAAG